MAPEQEALYALHWNVPRGELSIAAQLEYDRLRPAWERGETRPAAGELEAARLAWEGRARGAARPVTGDEIRGTTFLIAAGGYDVAQVDDLLGRIVAEIDADRPIEPLISNVSFRRGGWTHGYDVQAVDWFLKQFRLDHHAPAGTTQDPWRNLAVTAQFTRTEIGDLAGATTRQARQQLQAYYSVKCWKSRGRDFDELPGMHLRWEWTGITHRELRTQEKQTLVDCRGASQLTFGASGRTFALLGDQLVDKAKISSYGLGKYETGEARIPVLYVVGEHCGRRPGGSIRFPDQGHLQFPVQATERGNAVMTAVDEAGNRVARYRGPGTPFFRDPVEITVHPDWELTDQRALALAISAGWLRSYFSAPGGGGGG
jgi:DivIVA domain-containing protein